MPRAVTALAAALLALAGAAALALAQGGTDAPKGEQPTREVLYEDGHMDRYLLGGTWYLRLDPADQGEAQGLPTDPSLTGWSATTVPNAWNARDHSDNSQRGTVAWYRKDFVLPSRDAALRWKLRFESVNYRAKVWLNGVLIGEHELGYVPFELPTTGLVRDGVNRLVVRVDNRRTNADIPRGYERPNGRPGGGWWNYGGILREVYLRSFRDVDVQSVRVRTEISGSQRRAWLHFRVALENPTAADARLRLATTVGERERVSERPIRVGAGKTRFVEYTRLVHKPDLWEPGAPALYPVRIEALHGGKTLSGYRLNVGIREIRVTDNGLLLINGHRARLFGTDMHEQHPRRGAALLPRDRLRDMQLVTDLGARIIRAHYPLHPQYLELADKLGVMVWDEVPVYAQGYKGFEVPGVTDKSLAYIQTMVERDQNHPSVLAWSIANELNGRMTEDQEDYITRAAKLIHRLDPTRLRTIVIFGWPLAPPSDVYHQLDALGINSYFGWFPGPNDSTEDRRRLGPYLDQMRDYYPELALFLTEYGAASNHHGPAGDKGTYEFQRDFVRYHAKTAIAKRYLSGALAWLLKDIRVRPDWNDGSPTPQPPWNQMGLAEARWHKKPAFGVLAELYRSVRPVARRPYFGASR
jgi:beta-glucuronidase